MTRTRATALKLLGAAVGATLMTAAPLAYAAPSATPTPTATATAWSTVSASPTPKVSATASATPSASSTATSRAASPTPAPTAIEARWLALGGARSPLQDPVTGEYCGLRDGGCARDYRGGTIRWTPAAGAQPVWGAIRDAYRARGQEAGPLRYPLGAESCGLRDGGCFQAFQGGKLVFHADTGIVDDGTPPPAPVVGGGYPDGDAVPCGSSWCKGGARYSVRGFAFRNCTDFATWRRGLDGGAVNGNGDGNAIGWRQGWIQRGRMVSSVPRVGSIAWWGASRGGYGHVAIVLAVNPDGSVKVEHYNFDIRGGYSITDDIRAEAYLY